MIILFLSRSPRQTVITVEVNESFETHLYNENGYTEIHNVAYKMEEAIKNHKLLCEKCGIKVNM